jgi:hypothetical protein
MSSADRGRIYVDMVFQINFAFPTDNISMTLYESEILAQTVTHLSPAPIPSGGPQEYTYHET